MAVIRPFRHHSDPLTLVCSSGFFEIAVDDSVGGAARSSSFCDLNNDGFADIVEVQGAHIRVRMWDNQRVAPHTRLSRSSSFANRPQFSFAVASAAWTSAVLPRQHACGDVLYAGGTMQLDIVAVGWGGSRRRGRWLSWLTYRCFSWLTSHRLQRPVISMATGGVT